MLLLDTHVLVWLASGHPNLGRKARGTVDRSLPDPGVAVSAFSYWEVATLLDRGRLRGLSSAEVLRARAASLGILELAVDGTVAILAARLRAFHGDPADRLIVASAMSHGALLLTADATLLGWKHGLRTQDARR